MYTFTDLKPEDKMIMFPFNKNEILNCRWGMLPHAAQAVYPVLCCYANEKGIAFPDAYTIGCIVKMTAKTVRGGIQALIDYGWITAEEYRTKAGNKGYKYFIPKAPNGRGEWFPFFQRVLSSGAWFEATPTARALYPVLRCFVEYEYYDSTEDEDDLPEYETREWEYCKLPEKTSEILELAGITYPSFQPALESLHKVDLIGDVNPNEDLKVYLRPPKYYFRDYLNKQIHKMFKHIFEKKKNRMLSRLTLNKNDNKNKAVIERPVNDEKDLRLLLVKK